jgi:hypothetical protein
MATSKDVLSRYLGGAAPATGRADYAEPTRKRRKRGSGGGLVVLDEDRDGAAPPR